MNDPIVRVSCQFTHGRWSSLFVNASTNEETSTSRDIYVTLGLYDSSRMNAFPKHNSSVHQRRQCVIRVPGTKMKVCSRLSNGNERRKLLIS